MKGGASFFIALRYLLGRAKEGGRYLRGAAAGIALSLIPIVVTLIVADGMIRGITDRFLELGTGHLEVYNYGDPENPEKAADRIKTVTGFRGAWAEKRGLGVVVGPEASKGATIRAVDPSFWQDPGSLRFLETISGDASHIENGEVYLGEELARNTGAEAGKKVRIMTVRTGESGRTVPRVTAFTVKAIVSSGYRELDALWCVMTLEDGRAYLPDTASSFLMVKIDDPYDGANQAAREISSLLGEGHSVFTWKRLQQSQYSSYESTRQMLLFIMALIVMVAAVNVSSATSMLAIERQRDIAVFKSGGASPAFTSGVFLAGAFLTGLVGALTGLGAGLLLGVNINGLISVLEIILSFFSRLAGGGSVSILDSGYYLETIPIIVDAQSIALIGLFTIAASVIASFIPARRAGKLKPVEILRKY